MTAARSQQVGAKRNADVEVSRRMGYRVGINIGAVIWDDARVYGDDVNIAVRLQSAVAGLLRRCNEPVRRPRAYGPAQQGGGRYAGDDVRPRQRTATHLRLGPKNSRCVERHHSGPH